MKQGERKKTGDKVAVVPVRTPEAPGPRAKAGKEAPKAGARSKPKGGGPSKREGKAGRQELGKELARELLKLRPTLRDVSAAVLDRIDGQLVGLALMLGGEKLHGEAPPLPQARILEALRSELGAIRLKPRKGRVKDLARVDALLKAIAEKIPPGA